MRFVNKTNIILMLVVSGFLMFSSAITSYGFLSVQQQFGSDFPWNILMKKIHEKHWDIAYAFGEDCPEEIRDNPQKFEEAITESLQILLQPLQEIETKAPVVNEFRYQWHDKIIFEALPNVDLIVINSCERGVSNAIISNLSPIITLKVGFGMADIFKSHLIHELGHAIGLGDTYVGRNEAVRSMTKGGLRNTIGTQPASIMAGSRLFQHNLRFISIDDEKGIVWLYKVIQEGLAINDCFFADYKFESSPNGCVPKYPLIFEVMQGHEVYALELLNTDTSIDVNSRDESGSTALHYAVVHGSENVMNALLSRENIWVRPRNKDGFTPIAIARELGDDQTVQLLMKHPNHALEVAAKHKLATTWSDLKQRK